MHSKLLSVILMALVFVVACAAVPVTKEPTSFHYGGNSTSVSRRISTFSMGCKTNGNTKVCTDTNKQELVLYADFDEVIEHFGHLPNWKKTNSYEFCFSGACGAMTTLSGSEFIPSNYQSVANEAQRQLYATKVCVESGDPLYPSAVDVYFYDKNFVFSWWFNYANYWPCYIHSRIGSD
ncbi:hypothetical protein MFLAVUS_009724 [Mucor flavus]|uniref:Uncharacterized protein n=1 Tax=Mucor flavus TaxID=439312 RepID=A0ABP9ZAQ0_9FUNG